MLSKINLVVAGILLVLALAGGVFLLRQFNIAQINSFDECAAAGYPIRESYPAQCSVPNGGSFTQTIADQEITISGQVVCLPHKEKNGLQTQECAYGIRTNSGHYGLRDPDLTFLTNVQVTDKLIISGILSSEPGSIYDIVGVVTIEKLEKN